MSSDLFFSLIGSVNNWLFKVKSQAQSVNTVTIFDQSILVPNKKMWIQCVNRWTSMKIVAVFTNNIQCVMCILYKPMFAVTCVREKTPNYGLTSILKV